MKLFQIIATFMLASVCQAQSVPPNGDFEQADPANSKKALH